MRKLLIGFVLLLVPVVNACSVIPKEPTKQPPVDPPKIDLSILEVKVVAPYAMIAEELNRAIPTTLYQVTGQSIDDCPVSECSIQVTVLRNGPITVGHADNGRLVANVPIRTENGRIDAMKRVFGVSVNQHADFGASVTATVTLGFTLSQDWYAIPDAQLTFHVHTANVRIPFPRGSVTISVRSKLTELLNSQRGRLTRTITDSLRETVNFRSEAENAWSQLHAVLRLNDEPPLWLVVDPVSLNVENPRAEADGLRAGMGIDVHLSTHAQQDAPFSPEPEALPSLNVVQTIEGRYRLSMPIRVSVEEVNQKMNVLIGKEFNFEAAGRMISAKLIDGNVYTNGPDIVVYAEIRAANMLLGLFPIRVGAYLNGTPKYDTESTTIHLDPFDYDADSNNLLLDKAEWFFHNDIRRRLQEELLLNIGEDIDNARQLIANKLGSMPLGEYLVLRATVEKLEPNWIYTTEDALNVDVLAEGNINVELKRNIQ